MFNKIETVIPGDQGCHLILEGLNWVWEGLGESLREGLGEGLGEGLREGLGEALEKGLGLGEAGDQGSLV